MFSLEVRFLSRGSQRPYQENLTRSRLRACESCQDQITVGIAMGYESWLSLASVSSRKNSSLELSVGFDDQINGDILGDLRKRLSVSLVTQPNSSRYLHTSFCGIDEDLATKVVTRRANVSGSRRRLSHGGTNDTQRSDKTTRIRPHHRIQ